MTKRKFIKVFLSVVAALLFVAYLIWSYFNTWIDQQTAREYATEKVLREMKRNGLSPDDFVGPIVLDLPTDNVASFAFVWRSKIASDHPISVSVDRQSLEVKVYRDTPKGLVPLDVK